MEPSANSSSQCLRTEKTIAIGLPPPRVSNFSISNPSPEFFGNVVQIAVDKSKGIKSSHLVMLWHEVVLKLYEFLHLKKL